MKEVIKVNSKLTSIDAQEIVDKLLEAGKISEDDIKKIGKASPSHELMTAVHLFHTFFCCKLHTTDKEDKCRFYDEMEIKNPCYGKEHKMWIDKVLTLCDELEIDVDKLNVALGNLSRIISNLTPTTECLLYKYFTEKEGSLCVKTIEV